jgi:hypothetical protein
MTPGMARVILLLIFIGLVGWTWPESAIILTILVLMTGLVWLITRAID